MPSIVNNEMAAHDDESSLSFSTESSIGMCFLSYSVNTVYVVWFTFPRDSNGQMGYGFDVSLTKEIATEQQAGYLSESNDNETEWHPLRY